MSDFLPPPADVLRAFGATQKPIRLADGLAPAVIDFSPSFDNFDQYLARAELWRIVELETLYQMYGWNVLGQIEAHLSLIITERCA